MSEKSCQGPPTNTSCLLPSLSLFETGAEKSAEIREHGWAATDGVFIYFKRFCAGESHMRCISYFQRRFGEGGVTAVTRFHSRTRQDGTNNMMEDRQPE